MTSDPRRATTGRVTDSRLANLGARAVLDAFVGYMGEFRAVTRRAQERFEMRAWPALHADSSQRLAIYRTSVEILVEEVRALLGERIDDRLIWASMKAVFSGLIVEREDWELAETFFNSLTRKIFCTVGLDPQIEFVDSDFETPPVAASHSPYRRFPRRADLRALMETVLAATPCALRFEDLARDASLAATRLGRDLAGRIGAAEMLAPVFYRGERAYLVGRLRAKDETILAPLVLALRNAPEGLVLDAVLHTETDASILFSFTRSYFHVDVARPFELVAFLQSLMPRKRRAEIYNAVGFDKHGKTEQYRDLLAQLVHTEATFDFAPGVAGMVMLAFVMGDHDIVFKVIRDRFPPEKTTCREEIMAKYHMVFTHDRGGRLVEAQSFEHLAFPRQRFAPALLEELLREAAETVSLVGDNVVLQQAYIERRVTPLNLYLRDASPGAARGAVLDFGTALKDLAKTDIFPGDLLLKNFGVTRHGRVVFYDYDEITRITECVFRRMPQARREEEIMAAEPWFSVGPQDIFPEELPTFLGFTAEQKLWLHAAHAELFDHRWWQEIQARIRDGEIIHVQPYPAERRLRAVGSHSGINAPTAPTAAS